MECTDTACKGYDIDSSGTTFSQCSGRLMGSSSAGHYVIDDQEFGPSDGILCFATEGICQTYSAFGDRLRPLLACPASAIKPMSSYRNAKFSRNVFRKNFCLVVPNGGSSNPMLWNGQNKIVVVGDEGRVRVEPFAYSLP